MSSSFAIGERVVGAGAPCFVIAEAGVNHNGSVDLAVQLVDVAADCGADAIKFQTFRAEKLVTAEAKQAEYQSRNMGQTESQLTMLRRLELSQDDHLKVMAHCRQRGIGFLSTPFDEESADFLDREGMPAIKIPSGEVTNLPLIEHLAAKGRPVLLSTGMCRLSEVEACVMTLEGCGVRDLAILHCVSNYPAAPADTNLRAMRTMAEAFGHPVGYSDHTLGNEVSFAAVALGACVIEKHFTLDRSLPGPDHKASAEPAQLRQLVEGIRTIESAMGTGRKWPAAAELNTASVARRSVVAARTIPFGQIIRREDLITRRPGHGLAPAMIPQIVGMTAREEIPEGTLLSLRMVS
ncbi:N-acetylneuraminate synthase [Planctomyces sp. SH-PL14]|uniref:N-acetylneuraminate synthase n=1 Tax=Planctomyces sp. SH-PL14 TaxID=1632864 RepID=UPI00078E05DC|nr:N-acetylneuraminate synthase [Planctomyces sp. SH-PL14]AMV19964.1 N,N'-diacetyllegionaminic acid synthase [Planctomyces sp. SH-PL14]